MSEKPFHERESSPLASAVPNEGSSAYYGWLRHDILKYVPRDAMRVLSVGCGAGITEGELVARGRSVVGIERNAEAAAASRERGLTVLEGDALEVNLGDLEFDCIIYGDVLEHTLEPVSILRRHVRSLSTTGTVIVSVPNFRHYNVLWQLLVSGHIRYTDAGILDRTHVRLTTGRMVQEWFDNVGLSTEMVEYRMSQRRERVIASCSFGVAREFVARQVIVIGKRRAKS